jgi:hypothetical protein
MVSGSLSITAHFSVDTLHEHSLPRTKYYIVA